MKDILKSLNHVIQISKESFVNKSINRLDIVSREEFETQKKILFKTRQKLEKVQSELNLLLTLKK